MIRPPLKIKTKTKLVPKKELQQGGNMSSDRNQNLIQKAIRPVPDTYDPQQPVDNTGGHLGSEALNVPKLDVSKFTIPTLSNQLNTTTLAGPPKLPSQRAKGDGSGAAFGAGVAGMALTGAGQLIDSFKKPGPVNTWGIESQTDQGNKSTVASSTLQSAGKGVATGAAIGSIIPGIGTAIGAAAGGLIGGVIGLFKGRKQVKQKAKEYKDSTQMAYEDYNQKANAQQYAALAMHGAKLSIMNAISQKRNAISYKTRTFKIGGKLDKTGEVNIIPSGTLHKENNNLGQKDKGLPIIDEAGKKIFEVEREELILRLKTTKEVEDLVDKYKKSNNGKHLVDLGKLLAKEIMTNTHDFSGKFGMEVTS